MTRTRSSSSNAQLRLDCGLRDALLEFERRYFDFHLANADFSMTQVAASSGMERTNLYRKLKSLGFDLRSQRAISDPRASLDASAAQRNDSFVEPATAP